MPRTCNQKREIVNATKNVSSISFGKKKFDSFSLMAITGYLATIYYLLFDFEEFSTNMNSPINLFFWVLILVYPIIRYFIPFHIYKLSPEGIEIKNGQLISWEKIIEIQSYNNYEEQKNRDTPIYEHHFTLIIDKNTAHKIRLNNYTLIDKQLLKKYQNISEDKLKIKDIIDAVIISFYTRYK